MMMGKIEIFLKYLTFAVIIFVSVVECHYISSPSNSQKHPLERAKKNEGAVPGRVLQIPARDYRLGFKVEAPKLGECALKMEGNRIKTCSEKFGGKEVWIPRASTGVDVSRVQTADDIMKYGMGGVGVSVGILGLASVSAKVNVAVTTQTSNKHLTLMSSYDVKRGVMTLQNPRPLTEVAAEGTLYLSEIEYGGNEMFLVTMEFESVQKKIDVQVQLKVKILFITITAKMRYVKETFRSASSTRVQFKSSWRGSIDKSFSSLDDAIKEAEKIEAMYITGPEELRKLELNDEKLHSTYYFSAWKRSPYGENPNLASVNNDLTTLNEQYAEVQSVIKRIDDSLEMKWREFLDEEKKKSTEELKNEATRLSTKLNEALDSYHKLSQGERSKLLDIYGVNKAPGYYERKLKNILGY